MKKNGTRPVAPGEILNEEFLKPDRPDSRCARESDRGAGQSDYGDLKDQRGIRGETAIRLGTFFNTSAEFWMNLQMIYDLHTAEKALPARVRKRIEDNRSLLA